MKWQLLQQVKNVNENDSGSSVKEGNKDRNKSTCSLSPCAREMHSACCHDGKLFILGGRDGVGNIMSDVWMLQCVEVADLPGETISSPPVLMENFTRQLNENEIDDKKGNQNALVNENKDKNEHQNEHGKEHENKNEIIMGAAASINKKEKEEKVEIENIKKKSSCIIEELDLSNSRSQLISFDQKWEEKVKPYSVSISPKLNRKFNLIWHELPMLKLPAGRCAHTSLIVCDNIMVIGGVEGEIGITDSVLIIPYPVTLPLSFKPLSKFNSKLKSEDETVTIRECSSVDMKSIGKELTKGIWEDISSLINKSSKNTISNIVTGARFGHCVCVLSHSLSSKLYDNTSSHHTTLSPITNTSKHPNSVLIFGGVCAEKDFSDFVLLNIK